MPPQSMPYVLPLLIVTVLAIVLARAAWRRRPVPGTVAFTWLILAAATWSLAYALELGSPDLSTKIFWAKVQYLGIVMVPVSWLAFALQYTGREEWLTQRKQNTVLLMIVPLITLLLVWTNETHGLIWKKVELVSWSSFVIAVFSGGWWYWVNVAYAYLLLLLGALLLLQKFIAP